MSDYIKRFDEWSPIKKSVDQKENAPTFRRREIWWCCTGVNVGVEQDGKNENFERPVLIVRKFNRRLFWGVPLSTKIKDFPHHITIEFKATKEKVSKERSFIISQMRTFDSLRLTRPLGKLPHEQFDKVMQKIKDLL